MNKSIPFFILFLALALMQSVMAGMASDHALGIYGNANMDDTVDEKDVAYVEGVIRGTNAGTNLSDANYDGKIDALDVDQIKKILERNETELTLIDSRDRIVTVNIPIRRIVILNHWTLEV
ncbi:MAG: hypothetical protein M0Q43_10965, partial [Methanothrix sp.]|nr:hypothetical protein [Methanothrix sp.]